MARADTIGCPRPAAARPTAHGAARFSRTADATSIDIGSRWCKMPAHQRRPDNLKTAGNPPLVTSEADKVHLLRAHSAWRDATRTRGRGGICELESRTTRRTTPTRVRPVSDSDSTRAP